MTPNAVSLDELIRLEDVLPIEHDELMKSFSSMSFALSTFEPLRQVSFGGVQSVDYIESVMDMTDQDIVDRWYSKDELQGFKQAAKDLCMGERSGKQIDDEESSTRGMDVYFPGRQRHQAKYVYHVLQALKVHCVGRPDHVALLCEKWSAKGTTRATKRALQDFHEAYVPCMVQQQQHQHHGGKSIPSRPNKKRAAPAGSEERPRSL
jgi:hypothetical protein